MNTLFLWKMYLARGIILLPISCNCYAKKNTKKTKSNRRPSACLIPNMSQPLPHYSEMFFLFWSYLINPVGLYSPDKWEMYTGKLKGLFYGRVDWILAFPCDNFRERKIDGCQDPYSAPSSTWGWHVMKPHTCLHLKPWSRDARCKKWVSKGLQMWHSLTEPWNIHCIQLLKCLKRNLVRSSSVSRLTDMHEHTGTYIPSPTNKCRHIDRTSETLQDGSSGGLTVARIMSG